MLLRRATPLTFALAAAAIAIACEPSVPYDPAAHNPSAVDYAVFDPAPDPVDHSPVDVPLPNDLAFQPSAIASQPAAQAEVLTSFAAQGGWPADQDLPLTFDFVRLTIDPNTGATTRSAPPLDVTSINPSNLLILSLSAAGVGPVAYDAPVAADYATVGDHGTLTIRKKADANGLRHWSPATYVAAVRGGGAGVKLTGGGTVNPRPAMYLITQGADLTRPENQGLLPGATRAEKAANAAQLEQLRKAYVLPFAALQGAGFPTNEIATMTAFTVTPAVRVVADPIAAAAGVSSALPFPSDFLLDPVTHHLIPAAQDPVHGPFGPLGPPLGTLDGFSTTALITASTSGLIDPATVNKDTVFLYEYTSTGVKRISEVAEGPSTNPGFQAFSSVLAAQAGITAINVIGMQPAVPYAAPPGLGTPVLPLPALDDGSEYAVVLTDGVKDPAGARTVQATLGRLLALNNSLLSGTTPTVSGLDPTQAAQLEPLRQALKPVLDDLSSTKGITRDHVTMAYTFRTQSGIKTVAAQLAALPYGTPSSGANSTIVPLPSPAPILSCATATSANPACTAATSIAGTMSEYGINSPSPVPNANIGYIYEAKIVTFNKLLCNTGDTTCTDTGAFSPPTVNPVVEPINVLITLPTPGTPSPSAVNGCIPGPAGVGGNSANGVCTIPLVVFHHGFNDSRRAMLTVANEMNKAGYAFAAIDAPKHGDRAYCQADAECAGAGSTCVHDTALANESDAPLPTPGHCVLSGGGAADFVRDTTTCPSCTNTKSTPKASGNFLVSFNIFRTRDSLRQDIIDQSQLIRVLSPNPACDKTALPTALATTCANNLITAMTGFQIDPQKIYFTGQSLGSIQGMVDAAANARVKKVALNVGGGTIVDVFSQGSYKTQLNALLALKGLDLAHNPSGYIQFLTVAKWILDPADPINFAQHLANDTISFPAPLNALAPAPTTRPVMGQFALCDTTVPNPFNLELYELIGLGPKSSTTSTLTEFAAHYTLSTTAPACPANAVNHAFITDWTNYATLATQAQDDIAAFFSDSTTLPPPLRFTP